MTNLYGFLWEQPKPLPFYTFLEMMDHSQDAGEDGVWLNEAGNIYESFSAFSASSTSPSGRPSSSDIVPGHCVPMAAFGNDNTGVYGQRTRSYKDRNVTGTTFVLLRTIKE